jgi:lipoate---protein ligase
VNIYDHLIDSLQEGRLLQIVLWEPDSPAVVVGYSQQPAKEVYIDRCRQAGVPIIRRRGGGGSVVLMPGVLCLTLAFNSHQSDSPYYFFQKINSFLSEQLEALYSIRGIMQAGISDLAIGDKKILGCSMHKSRHRYLYQGSLLVHPDLDLIDRFLRHPSKEPEYRNQRGHQDFVSGLQPLGYAITVSQIKNDLEKNCREKMAGLLL